MLEFLQFFYVMACYFYFTLKRPLDKEILYKSGLIIGRIGL